MITTDTFLGGMSFIILILVIILGRRRTPRRKGCEEMTEPLTIRQQERLISRTVGEKEKAALVLFLSTGIHPKCIAFPDEYKLSIGEYSMSWKRTKKKTEGTCTLSLSSAFRESRHTIEKKLMGKSKVWLWTLVSRAGKRIEMTLNARLCRHTALCNFVRLNKDIFYIRSATGTTLDTISGIYTIGIEDKKRMTQEERQWLEWLMEPP